jgi:hypothetical protein
VNKLVLTALTAAALLLAACQPSGAMRSITRGEEVYFNDFTQPASFEEGTYQGATLRVREGIYRIDVTVGDGTLWWGQYGETRSDVVIDVDAEQISERPETLYGVMCRVRGTVGQAAAVDPTLAAIMADETAEPEATEAAEEATPEAEATESAEEAAPEAEATEAAAATESTAGDEPASGSGDGYLFLLDGNGNYAIMVARGRSMTPLVNWTASDAINAVPGSNRIRAICVGDYLAMSVNDTFLADTTDDTYREGQIGLAAGAANRLGVRVDFDNLSVALPEGS